MNALNPVKTVGSQIVEPMEFHGTARGAAAEKQASALLELVGIPASAAERYPHEFSGGMRQRAAIAMALACDPKVLLADEPTTALDVMVQAQILQLLVSLTRDLGLAVILVTHDLPLVTQVCERAVVMYAGRIAESGPVDTLFHDPRHPYTRLLFEATPDLRGEAEVVSIPGAPPRLDRTLDGCPFEPRCDRAFDRCKVDTPQLAMVATRHEAACHLNDAAPGQAGAGVAGGDGVGRANSAARRHGSRSGERELLEVRDLVVRYPLRRGLMGAVRREPHRFVSAVDGVSLFLGPGEMLAIVGESGCGKTSTAQAILRMVDATSGVIRVGGRNITHLDGKDLRTLRSTTQMVYQDPYESLDPRFRVRRAVEEPMVIHGIGGSKTERERLVIEALESVELSPADLFIDRYPHELSGGQRQRVAIAASLVLQPKLLLADEPVSMLDVSIRAGILALLDNLRRDRDMAVVMITHDLSTAAHFADRIAVMYLGRIVEEGPARQVIGDPQHPYTKALMSVVPKRDPRDHTEPQILQGETPDPIDIPTGCRFHPRCPVAVKRCSEIDPELRAAAGMVGNTHRAACILV
jgi:peptide/nickel transport system ATP-binding protein